MIKHENQDGFTLIELVVVVLIIGLLAGIAVPRLTRAWDDAKASACRANMKQIEAALELYYFEHGSYPVEASLFDDLNLKNIPTCPQGNTSYVYHANNSASAIDYRIECSKHGYVITSTSESFKIMDEDDDEP